MRIQELLDPLAGKHQPHQQMRGGAVNVGGTIAIRTTASAGESTYAGIVPAVVNGHVDP